MKEQGPGWERARSRAARAGSDGNCLNPMHDDGRGLPRRSREPGGPDEGFDRGRLRAAHPGRDRNRHAGGDAGRIFRRGRGERGFSLLEALVSMSMLGILLGTAVIGLRGRFLDFASSTQTLLNDLRLARADAVTKGAHYRLSFSGDGYKIERLQDDDGDGWWDPPLDGTGAARTIEWPADITAGLEGNQGTSGSGDPSVEFDTRGMLVPTGDEPLAETVLITVEDEKRRKKIQVWPSGQMGFLTD